MVPYLLMPKRYRMGPHSANDEDDYRPEGEMEAWKERDPIVLMKKSIEENWSNAK